MSTEPNIRPDLSVIVPSFNARRTIVACLEALRAQRTEHTFEVIVVDSGSDGTAELIRERFPEVTLIHSAERLFPGGARNAAIAAAQADIVANVDADCVAEPDWVDQILAAHSSPSPVIAGPVASANPESWIGQAYYFCEFSIWMPGGKGGWLEDSPTANMSYKKSLFTSIGSFRNTGYCEDTELHWRAGRAGHKILFVPSIIVKHNNPSGFLKLLRHQAFHGRSFARVRTRFRPFPLWKRLVYLVLSPFIPVVLFARIVWRNLTNRVYLRRFLLVWPLVAAGIACWSWGEAQGYAASLGKWRDEEGG